jgi:hypothetical protein
MSTTGEYRQLTPADVEEAAQVIAQSFVDDPLTSFMLPFKRTRIKRPSNVPLYQHFGFECVEESPVDGTGITVNALRRSAR